MTVWHSISANSQIVVIHPNYTKHRYLLATLLPVANAEYCCLSETLNQQDFNFAGQPDFIVLTEFDRLAEVQATALLDAMLSTYPASKIIIFSRNLPDLEARHRSIANLFPIDEEMGLVDYFQASRPIVEFFGLGMGAVAVNGKRKPVWQHDVQPLLLFYLLEKGSASRETLLKEFWPRKRGQAAVRALHNLKARLHELLELEELIVFQGGVYRINPDFEIIYDVWRYKSLIEAAYNAAQGLDLTHFAQAHDAYTGEYLIGRSEAWIRAKRANLQALLAEADYRLAKILEDFGEKDRAAAWYSFAFQLNSTRDDVMMALMKLFLELNIPCHALHFFYRYEENLREKYDICSGKRILALAEQAKEACLDYSSSSL
jgi:DNA-binding SARP family transcriptional activator